MNQILE